MRLSMVSLALPGAAALLVACATSGSGGSATTLREQLGSATPGDLSRKTRLVFERFQFEIERQDSSTTYQVYESRWKGRYPLQDEVDSGVTEAMTRLIVRARARGGGGIGSTDVRVVEFVAENMVRVGEEPDWRRDLFTPLFREYVGGIAEALRTEFLQGIRVF